MFSIFDDPILWNSSFQWSGSLGVLGAGYLASQAASQVLAVRLSGGGQEEDTDCLDLFSTGQGQTFYKS